MNSEEGSAAAWRGYCQTITESLKRGEPIWANLRKALGEEACKQIETVINGDPVWVIDQKCMASAPRRSMLDYADVATINAVEKMSKRHVSFDEPTRITANSGTVPPQPTCSAVSMNTALQKALWHNISQDVLADTKRNIVYDILSAFHDRIVLDIEESIYAGLQEAITNNEVVRLDARGKNDDEQTDVLGILSSNDIINAALTLSKNNPHISFPDDIVCVISPVQAMQILKEGSTQLDRMSVHGIDLVISPAVQNGLDPKIHTAMVSVKQTIRVGISKIEIRVKRFKYNSIWAEYGMGTKIDPSMTVAIVSKVD